MAGTILASGCLFPPVETTGGDADDPGPDPSPGPKDPIWVSMQDAWQQPGNIERAASAGNVPVGEQVHEFDLPARVQEMRLRLEWDSPAGEDLDVRFDLYDTGEVIWSHDADAGQTGSPDDVDLDFVDVAEIFSENETQLVATVTAKAAYDVSYILFVQATYLEAR